MIWFALLTAAHAWEPIFPSAYTWDTTEPIVVNLGEEAATGLTAQQTQDAMRAALEAWSGIECTGGLELVVGTIGPSTHTFDIGDGENWINVGDPDDYLFPGEYGSTLVNRSDTVGWIMGGPVRRAFDGDISLNDGVTFTTTAAIDAGECTDAIEIGSVLTFLVGHLVGLGRSHEPGSVMNNWNPAPCTKGPPAPTPDDIAGLQALYGFPDEVVCTPSSDVAPTDVTCEVTTPEGASTPSASWRLPDGTSANGLSVTFGVTGPGLAEVCFTRDECSGTEHCDLIPISVEPPPVEFDPIDTGAPVDSGTPLDDGASDDEDDAGCGCSQGAAPANPVALLALGLLVGFRRRSRSA